MAQLTGSANTISLGKPGYAIRASALKGRVELLDKRDASRTGRARVPEDGTNELDQALRSIGIEDQQTIALDVAAARPGAPPSARAVGAEADLELTVPNPGATHAVLVLCCDEHGTLSWHLPGPAPAPVRAPTRGAADGVTIRIPVRRLATTVAPGDPTRASRSLLGTVGRKVLKVLVYPLLDPLVGRLAERLAGEWEASNRPYKLRGFTPQNFRQRSDQSLSGDDWRRIAGGRALLFVHGTFSTSHAAFGGLSDDCFRSLYERYESRVFAFDHYTLSESPLQNADWLMRSLPPEIRFKDVDIVCHSRGGLLARTLAEKPNAFGLDNSRLAIDRVIHVGVPNQGTKLAEPDHMVDMLSRLTTALNLFPSGPVTETLESILIVLKVIGHGALGGLAGLAAMDRNDTFLKTLNAGTPANAKYFAIAADYEPTDVGWRSLLGGAANSTLDYVFEDAPNDLVVPQRGVYETNGSPAFPVDGGRLLKIPADAGVMHTTLFGHAPVQARIQEWLA